jgi:hypothetical protein
MHPDTELEAELEAATPIPEAPVAPDREEVIAREAALFEPVTAAQLADRSKPPMLPLVTLRGEPYLPAGEVGVVAGEGGIGKTTFLAALVAAVATGLPALGGQLQPRRSGRVLIVAVEERREMLLAKLDDALGALCPGNPAALVELREKLAANVLLRCGGGRLSMLDEVTVTETLDTPAHLPSLGDGKVTVRRTVADPTPFAEAMRRTLDAPTREGAAPWALVILDPLSRFYSGNENDNATAARFVNACEALRDTRDRPTVILAHHVAKGSTSARGASALTDNPRFTLQLRASDPDGLDKVPESLVADYRSRHRAVIVEVAKGNYGRTMHNGAEPLRLRIVEELGRVTVRLETAAQLDGRRSAENGIAAAALARGAFRTNSPPREGASPPGAPLENGALSGMLAARKASTSPKGNR